MSLDFGIINEMLNFDIGLDVIKIILIAITIIAVTRNGRHIRMTALPMIMAFRAIGMEINIIWTISAAIIGIITAVGANKIGSSISSFASGIKETVQVSRRNKQSIGLTMANQFRGMNNAEIEQKYKEKQTAERMFKQDILNTTKIHEGLGLSTAEAEAKAYKAANERKEYREKHGINLGEAQKLGYAARDKELSRLSTMYAKAKKEYDKIEKAEREKKQ